MYFSYMAYLLMVQGKFKMVSHTSPKVTNIYIDRNPFLRLCGRKGAILSYYIVCESGGYLILLGQL